MDPFNTSLKYEENVLKNLWYFRSWKFNFESRKKKFELVGEGKKKFKIMKVFVKPRSLTNQKKNAALAIELKAQFYENNFHATPRKSKEFETPNKTL